MFYSSFTFVLNENNGYFNLQVGRTEQIKESLNPIFSKRISLKYYFEQVQDLKICIYDVDNSSSTLKDDDFLGKTYMTLGQVVYGVVFFDLIFVVVVC